MMVEVQIIATNPIVSEAVLGGIACLIVQSLNCDHRGSRVSMTSNKGMIYQCILPLNHFRPASGPNCDNECWGITEMEVYLQARVKD